MFAPSPSRVLIVDDDSAFVELIQCILAAEPAFEVVGRGRDGAEGVELARRLRPDLVLMDLRMPRMDGFEATREISAALGAARILVVSSSHDPADVDRALEAGAAAYLPKSLAAAELVGELRRLAQPRSADRRRLGFGRGYSIDRRAVPFLRPGELGGA